MTVGYLKKVSSWCLLNVREPGRLIKATWWHAATPGQAKSRQISWLKIWKPFLAGRWPSGDPQDFADTPLLLRTANNKPFGLSHPLPAPDPQITKWGRSKLISSGSTTTRCARTCGRVQCIRIVSTPSSRTRLIRESHNSGTTCPCKDCSHPVGVLQTRCRCRRDDYGSEP